jgi:hypothetical protein
MDATLRLGGSFRVTNKPLHLPSIVPETPMEENAMAKDRKPAEDSSAFANQGMAQARNAVDTYFDFLKTAVSSTRRVEQSSVKGSRAMQNQTSPRLTNLSGN